MELYDADKEWQKGGFNFTRQEKQYLKTHSFLSPGQIKSLEIDIRVVEDRYGRNWKNPNLQKAAHSAMRGGPGIMGQATWGPANLKLADNMFGDMRMIDREISYWNTRQNIKEGVAEGRVPTKEKIILGRQRQAAYSPEPGLLAVEEPPHRSRAGSNIPRGLLSDADLWASGDELAESPEERKKKKIKAKSDIRKRFNLKGAPLQQSYTSIIGGGPYRKKSIQERIRDILE